MNVSEFDYELPERLIAQEPLARRDASRLLVMDRATRALEHRVFSDLPELLRPGDLVVFNDTRVVPARLRARKETGGKVEVLLVERTGGTGERPRWRCLVQASKPPAVGSRLAFGGGLSASVLAREGESWEIELHDVDANPEARIESLGAVPLPPYIRRAEPDPRDAVDRERYQTVFARRPGAVAAPTAGLHFTPDLLSALAAKGVGAAYLTLHVGPGTFLPVRVPCVEQHVMHSEAYDIPAATALAVETARRGRGRIVAVGTTVVRALEAAALGDGQVGSGPGRSALFVYPGFRFQVVNVLVTNFHLPRSTLLMLVSAFAGADRVLAAYREAIRLGYRFYSYGDAMLVRPGA